MKRLKCFLLAFFVWLMLLCGCQFQMEEPVQPDSAGGLSVHYIDVGQADCTLLECDGQTMLIDGGNAEDSSMVVSYLRSRGINYLDYVVCTHAHEDHVGGLSGPLNTCSVGQVFAPVTEYDSKVFSNFVYYTEKQGLNVEVPAADDVFALGGATVTVLGPREEYGETNDTSIVLRVDYGNSSFLFTGDMERAAEEDLLEAGCNLDVDVLKVGHHGSNTSSSYVFLREVMPEYGVISCGKDNDYGHPHDEVVSRLKDAGTTILRTDEHGTVTAFSDGETIVFAVEKGVLPSVEEAEPIPVAYIGNKKSQVFHRTDCSGLPAEHNRVSFNSRDAAVDAGYKACGNCKP